MIPIKKAASGRIEAKRLGEILPGVLQTIESRCNQYRQEHELPMLDEEFAKRDGVKCGVNAESRGSHE